MSLVSNNKAQRIAFYRNHLQQWLDNASLIGMQTTDVTELQTLVTTAEADYAAQQLAQQAAKDAVATCTQSVALMHYKGMELVKQVRAKATSAGDSVYPLAGLPVPPVPAPVGPPGTPYDFAVGLLPNGSLELTWKCDNPANAYGTLYHIYRKDAGKFDFIAGVGEKKFIDTTVPAGTATILYQIQAARTTSIGVANQFIVNLGIAPATGTMTATVSDAKAA